VAKLLNRAGATVITAAISPYAEARNNARTEIGAFVEIYVCCPLPVCMQRDVKGLYARALRGDLQNLTGFSDPYEAPVDPDIIVQTDRQTPEESLDLILDGLDRLGYLSMKGRRRERPIESRPGPTSPLRDELRWSV
jgi:adenylylsulfate kinase